MSDTEVEEIFNIKLSRTKTQPLAGEYLAETKAKHNVETKDEVIRQVYEITINIPSKYYENIEMLDVYKTIWQKLTKEYKSPINHYVVEFCKSNQMHIHGYMYVDHPANNFYINDEGLRLHGIWLYIMKLLDKRLWRINNNRYTYQKHYRKCFSPAICINCKDIVFDEWLEYINKNAPKNS